MLSLNSRTYRYDAVGSYALYRDSNPQIRFARMFNKMNPATGHGEGAAEVNEVRFVKDDELARYLDCTLLERPAMLLKPRRGLLLEKEVLEERVPSELPSLR